MKYRIAALALLAAATMSGPALHGQGRKNFSWQNLCFNNPAAPPCQGRNFAIKPDKKAAGKKKGSSSGSVGEASSAAGSDIDWRFADPGADVLAGFNVAAVRDSALARNLLLQLGSKRGLNEIDIQKAFELLAGVDQIFVSVYNNHAVAMLTGKVSEEMFPAPESGLRAVKVSANALLFGRAGDVDESRQRMTTDVPLSQVTGFASDVHSDADFWAIGLPKYAGPQALNGGVRRIALTVGLGEQLSGDFGLQFFSPPTKEKLKSAQPILGEAVIDGSAIHVRRTVSIDDAQQALAGFLASPVADQLGLLISTSRYLQPSQASKQTRPVIIGLNSN